MSILDDYPVTLEMDVRWGDMDAMGHTNNAVYFQYFESARIEFFRQTDPGARLSGMDDDPRGYIIASASMDFLEPLSYPDCLVVGVRPENLQTKRYDLSASIYSKEREGSVAEGESVILSYHYQQSKVIPIPDPAVKTIRSMME